MINDILNTSLENLLPHAKPMMLLSKLIEFGDEHVICSVYISKESLFYAEHIQGVPAWIGIEYMAQSISAYAGIQAKLENNEIKLGYLIGCRRFESDVASFKDGDNLQVKAQKLYQEDNGLGGFDCEISLQNKIICHAKLNIFTPDIVV